MSEGLCFYLCVFLFLQTTSNLLGGQETPLQKYTTDRRRKESVVGGTIASPSAPAPVRGQGGRPLNKIYPQPEGWPVIINVLQ